MSIRKRGRRAYQVRVEPFPAVTVPTREAAVALDLDLKLRKKLGHLFEEKATTLGDELDGLVAAKDATAGLSERGVEWYRQSVKAWAPIRRVLVPNLRRATVEDVSTVRAKVAPTSARNELEVLKQALHRAASRGQRVDQAIFDIPPVKTNPREGKALTPGQLLDLTSFFPEYVKRLVQLAGTVGARQHFWFALTDDLLDLDEGTMPIPSELAKNRRDHRVYLTPTETRLLREQLLARPAGTRLVFPTVTGRRWTRHHFRDRVWTKAVTAAALHDRQENGVEASVFDGFTFHLLRHTAGSLMALAGMDPAVASERMSHTDGGALFLRTYRHLYEGEKRRHALRLEALLTPDFRSAMDEEGTGTA